MNAVSAAAPTPGRKSSNGHKPARKPAVTIRKNSSSIVFVAKYMCPTESELTRIEQALFILLNQNGESPMEPIIGDSSDLHGACDGGAK